MSENKCPVCGSELSGSVDGIIECKNGCSFRCGGYALPRIAAAMDYTKCQIDLHGDFGFPESHMQWLREEGKKAWERVKEVFA